MLVTFSCPAYADIMMFGDVAVHLLTLMGHSGAAPSALVAADVPEAIERLEAAVTAAGASPVPGTPPRTEDEEPAVSLRHRALPLIDLLGTAAQAKCNVLWKTSQ